MPENTPTDETTTETPAETTAPDGAESTKETPPESGEESGLDEKTKAQMSKLRGEAAGWRTQVRDLQAKLETAVTPEQIEQVRTESGKKISQLERELVIATAKLPKDLADLLPEGLSMEDLAAKATALAKYAPASDEEEDLSGGLNPGQRVDVSSPRELAKRARTGSIFR